MNRQTTNSESQSEKVLAKIIVLGLDVHADSITVVRQVDGGMPQPPQTFPPSRLPDWVTRQRERAETVWSCYEAGPFGYVLHRQLEALGVRNLVVCPQSWDELGTGVKTDKGDARALCVRLALYAAGNRHIFTVVRVPTPEQERARAESRLREQVRRTRQRIEAQGRSLLLTQGCRVTGRWWQSAAWLQLSGSLPVWLVELLEPLRECIVKAHQKTERLTQTVEEAAKGSQPVGLGALSSEVIDREIGDWSRFSNRRQIASYTGLCPGEHSSGGSHRRGSVTKHGNPRLRHTLIETAWRLVRYQPEYRAVRRWIAVLGAPARNAAARKKAIVAIARQLAVDLWRIRTGRVAAEALGLRLNLNENQEVPA
jgi:transposase